MKKVLLICLLLLLGASKSYCLDPIRVSVTTTPNITADLTIDLLESNGTLKSHVYTETNKSSGTTGAITVIVDGLSWRNSDYSKDYLVRVTYGTTVLSIERLEAMIAKQALYGATISTDDIDPAADFSFKSLSVNGDFAVAGKTTLKGLIPNVLSVTIPSSNSATIDLSNSSNNTMIVNVNGYSNAINDTLKIINPTEGQILLLHYDYATAKRLYLSKTYMMSQSAMRILVYIASKWHFLASDGEL